MNRFAQLALIAAHEARVLSKDRSLWWALGLLAALIGYSLYTGLVDVRERDAAAAQMIAADAARAERNVASLRAVLAGTAPADPFSNPADPASVGGGLGAGHAILPTAPLAPLAVGQSDMLPSSYRVDYGSKVEFMYDTELENPWNLVSGHLDLSFVLTYVLPLLILALCYNLLSAERELGTLRMVLSQPLALTTLVAGKLGLRVAALLGCAIGLPVIIVLLARPEARTVASLGLLASWAALVAAYGLFWFALALLVNALGRTSATNALVLAAFWVALVLVAPVGLNLAVQAASPAPSRTELATTTRVITIQGLERYNDLLSTDYRYTGAPELLLPQGGRFQVQPRLRAMYFIDRDIDTEVEKVLDRFDAQLAGQQVLVDRFGWLSPAVTTYEGMTAIAGSGSKRYQDFQNQVDSFHRAWRAFFDPKMTEGTAMTEEDFARLPRFIWREASADGSPGAAMRRAASLLALATLLAYAAWMRLRRYRPV